MCSPTIGIDLGTTFSCVAVLQHGKVEIIANEQGNRTTPSCVAFTEAERLVGEVARNQAARNPENTVFEAKRLIGRTFDDPKVQEDIKHWPFKVIDDGGRPHVQVEFQGETKRFTAQEISAMVLTKMKTIAESYLATKVKDAVITVPAYFNDAQRQATKDAATIAGLDAKRIINEPTAAALAYGLDKKLRGEQNVMIFDLGGGTFDVSILSIADGSMFEVLATAGDTHLGGEDFDNKMVDYFVKEFKRKYKKDATSSPRAMRKLKMACEQAKRALSSCAEAAIEIDSFYQGIYFYSKISRARFEELCNDLFRSTLEPVEMALKDAKMNKSDIHEVVLVGGSTRIPKIQKLMRDFFDGRKLNMSINPDEAVAYGAAVQAAVLSSDPTELVKDVLLVDVVPLSLGTDHGQHQGMCNIIERNTRIPVVKSKNFSLGRDYQTAVHVGVYEGERALVKDNHMLGEFELTGLRAARRGEVSVTVQFDIDADGILSVNAKEDQTGKSMQVTITNSQGRLSKPEIERMLREAEEFQQQDQARLEAADAMQTLEMYAYNAGRSVEECGDALTESERQLVSQRSQKAIEWMGSNTLASKDEVNHQLQELKQQLEPILAKIRQPGSGGQYTPQPGTQHPTGGTGRRGRESTPYGRESSPSRGQKPSPYRGAESYPSGKDPDEVDMNWDQDETERQKGTGGGLEESEEDALGRQRATQDLLRGLMIGERGPRASTRGLWGGLPGSMFGDQDDGPSRPLPDRSFTPVMEEVD